jgi:hypothetical protein
MILAGVVVLLSSRSRVSESISGILLLLLLFACGVAEGSGEGRSSVSREDVFNSSRPGLAQDGSPGSKWRVDGKEASDRVMTCSAAES